MSDDRYEVYIRDLNTDLTRNLSADAAPMPPSWSPNGHSIAFFPNGPLTVYDTMTNQVQNFPFYATNNVYPEAWSPDGNLLAVTGIYEDKPGGLYILNMASGEVQALSQGEFTMTNYPAWSPDGRYLTFSASKGSSSSIYRVDLQTNTLSQFVRSDDNTVYVASAWSPGGRTIAITTATSPSEVHLLNLNGDLIRKINLSQQIPDVGGGDNQVAWSPDGKYFFLYVPVNSQWHNYAYELATDAAYPLSPDNRCDYTRAIWRPDPA